LCSEPGEPTVLREVNDLLWCDSTDDLESFAPSSRGCGFRYGKEATEEFLQKSGLSCMIRAHELCDDGFRWHFGRAVLTLFSTADYCDGGNDGAVALYSQESGLQFAVFEPLSAFGKSPSVAGEWVETDVEENSVDICFDEEDVN
jgi:hypothetical protein